MHSLRTLCKTFASGELVKLRGAQQARQGCRTAAYDTPAESRALAVASFISTRTAWSSWWRAVSTATSSPACQCQNGRDMLQADCQSCHLHRGRWPNTPGWSVKRPAALAQPHVQGAHEMALGVGERAPGSAPGEPRRFFQAKICSGAIAHGPRPEDQTLNMG